MIINRICLCTAHCAHYVALHMQQVISLHCVLLTRNALILVNSANSSSQYIHVLMFTFHQFNSEGIWMQPYYEDGSTSS